MASNSKFNLTQLLNARSKEVAAVDTAAEEKETTTEAVTATADI